MPTRTTGEEHRYKGEPISAERAVEVQAQELARGNPKPEFFHMEPCGRKVMLVPVKSNTSKPYFAHLPTRKPGEPRCLLS